MTINFRKAISIFTTSWLVKPAFVVCYFIVFTFSCKNPQKISLERQVSENPAGVFYTDTFQVNTETILIDTPSTKNKPHLIIGNFEDDVFSKISTEAYTKMILPGKDTLTFNKITDVIININYDFVLGPTDKPFTLNINALAANIDSLQDYNRLSSIDTASPKLGSVTFNYSSTNSNSISCPALIPYFNDLKDKKFSANFNGLALTSQNESSFAIGLNTGEKGFSITIVADSNLNNRTLYVGSKTPRFSKATANIAPVLSNKSNQISYLNDMLGVGARISIPGLNLFLEKIRGNYIVTEASFIIPSSNGFQQDVNRPFPAVYMFETDVNGNRTPDKKIVQSEFNLKLSYLVSPLDKKGNELYISYNNTLSRFNFPYTLHVRDINIGKLSNNPLIIAESSATASNQFLTQSPFTFSFEKGSSNGKKIQFVVYYNKIVK